MVSFAHHYQRTGAAHAGFGIDALFPQGLRGILKIHYLYAGYGSGAGLCRGLDHLFFRGGGLGGCLARFKYLVQTGLFSLGEFSARLFEYLALNKLGCILQRVRYERGAGSAADYKDKLVVTLADAGAIAKAGGFKAAAGGCRKSGLFITLSGKSRRLQRK